MVSRKKKLALGALWLLRVRRQGRRHRTVWVKPWIQRRDTQGVYHNLVRELQGEDSEMYRLYFRMQPTDFQNLLAKIAPLITKQDTKFRQAISPSERLAVTLRFLATGKNYLLHLILL